MKAIYFFFSCFCFSEPRLKSYASVWLLCYPCDWGGRRHRWVVAGQGVGWVGLKVDRCPKAAMWSCYFEKCEVVLCFILVCWHFTQPFHGGNFLFFWALVDTPLVETLAEKWRSWIPFPECAVLHYVASRSGECRQAPGEHFLPPPGARRKHPPCCSSPPELATAYFPHPRSLP